MSVFFLDTLVLCKIPQWMRTISTNPSFKNLKYYVLPKETENSLVKVKKEKKRKVVIQQRADGKRELSKLSTAVGSVPVRGNSMCKSLVG